MARVKRGTTSLKTRKYILARAKGFRFRRSKTQIGAMDALRHAGKYAFNHRKDKKTDARRLFTVRLNAGLRELGISYSKFIASAKAKNVTIDRKILSDLAANNVNTFKNIVEFVK